MSNPDTTTDTQPLPEPEPGAPSPEEAYAASIFTASWPSLVARFSLSVPQQELVLSLRRELGASDPETNAILSDFRLIQMVCCKKTFEKCRKMAKGVCFVLLSVLTHTFLLTVCEVVSGD